MGSIGLNCAFVYLDLSVGSFKCDCVDHDDRPIVIKNLLINFTDFDFGYKLWILNYCRVVVRHRNQCIFISRNSTYRLTNH